MSSFVFFFFLLLTSTIHRIVVRVLLSILQIFYLSVLCVYVGSHKVLTPCQLQTDSQSIFLILCILLSLILHRKYFNLLSRFYLFLKLGFSYFIIIFILALTSDRFLSERPLDSPQYLHSCCLLSKEERFYSKT